MIWISCDLYSLVETSTDETKKPICTLTKTGTANLRPLPFRPVTHPISGNEQDIVTRTFFTASDIGDTAELWIGNEHYTVDHCAKYGRGYSVTAWRAK